MALAPLVLTALVIIFIMQIIIIVKVNRATAWMRGKQNKELQTSVQKSSRKDRNTKEYRKESKHPSGAQSKTKETITSVDKSLRDINLRLKDAERSQEKARKRLSTSDSVGLGRKPGRDMVKKIDKNRQESSRSFKNKSSSEPRKFKSQPPVFSPSSRIEEISIDPQKASPISVAESINSSEESFKRDNKASIKRRSLNKPEEKVSETKETVEQPAVVEDAKTPEEQKISFGRR